MHTVILAGGAGTRMRPLTYARRKELLPLLNRPLLEYRLRNLAEHGLRDVVLACSQGMHEVEQHFGDGAALGLRIAYNYEDRPLGSGRAVKEAARAAGATGTIVVCNGDILTNIDLTAMWQRHRETGAALSMSLAPVDDPWQFGVVAVDDELRISKFVEKPPRGQEPSRLINAGTWLCEPEVIARIPDDETAVRDGYAERVLFPGIIAEGLRVQGFIEDLWVDVGSPERYLRATRMLLEREAARSGSPLLAAPNAVVDAGAVVGGLLALDAGSRIHAAARVEGPSVIGEDSDVADDAAVRASVLWERVRVERGARVEDSIIADNVQIGAGAIVRDSLVASGAVVPAGMELQSGARVMPGAVATATG